MTSLSSGLGGYDSDGSALITYTLRTIARRASPDFGVVTTGQSQSETITISNSGGQPLTINQAALGGANASEFSLVSGQDNCPGAHRPGERQLHRHGGVRADREPSADGTLSCPPTMGRRRSR